MFVAVVYVENSGRPYGDLASFTGKTKAKAVEAALLARGKWEQKGFGPYRILVGKLSEEVTTPARYDLARLKM